jgi:hypothetical protein
LREESEAAYHHGIGYASAGRYLRCVSHGSPGILLVVKQYSLY